MTDNLPPGVEKVDHLDETVMGDAAIYCNRFQLSALTNGLVRVSFGEGMPERPYWRGAFIATSADMINLAAALVAAAASAKEPAPAPETT